MYIFKEVIPKRIALANKNLVKESLKVKKKANSGKKKDAALF